MLRSLLGISLLAPLIAGFVGLVSEADATGQRFRKSPPVVVAAAPEPTAKLGDGNVRKKLLLAVVRHRAITKMQSEGVKGKKYTRAEAEAAFDKLQADHPDLVEGAIAEGSPAAVAQVGAGGRLADLLQWISDHSAEIMKIVTLILQILALFG